MNKFLFLLSEKNKYFKHLCNISAQENNRFFKKIVSPGLGDSQCSKIDLNCMSLHICITRALARLARELS